MEKYTKKTLVSALLCFTLYNLKGQAQWQHWNGFIANYALEKQHNLRISHTRSFDINNSLQSIFNQTQFIYTYEPTKKIDVQFGVAALGFPKNETRRRAFIRVAHTSSVAENINWTNSIRLETNSKNETRFSQRVIITSRLGLRKRLEFLNLAPSIAYTLFYIIGGKPINYYDANSVFIEQNTPNGFRRSRFTISLNSKINKVVQITIYYMAQREFNFLSTATTKMNVFDPVRNRIVRPFNDYKVLGLTTHININQLIK